jgi:hypothetical protein
MPEIKSAPPTLSKSFLFVGLVLVYRLAYNGDVAAGQLAVFQGASEVPISVIHRPASRRLILRLLNCATPDS